VISRENKPEYETSLFLVFEMMGRMSKKGVTNYEN